jgi:hypothetical protein
MRFIPEAPNSAHAAKDIAMRLPGGRGRRDPWLDATDRYVLRGPAQ